VLYAALYPGLGAMRLPVALYVVAISAMVAAGVRAGELWAVGAVLFLISDSVLAWNRFRGHVPAEQYLIWTTYYGGQLLIALETWRRGIAGCRARPVA
jgi:uncharacterized membrane protein YhhN